ncbi:MAG TPA: outer membrane beta-barrel protein, partial [Actinomycetota bacterium]|nr:outer membrane beta-barrel protein [Actinomycetota bacterium]
VSSASAQVKWDLTPFAGYYIASDLFNDYAYSGSASGGSGVELTNSFAWGGRLTAINRRGAVEFAYTRTGSDVKLRQQLVGQPSNQIGRIDLDNYDINFIGYEPTGNPKVTPFGVIGFGWTITHPEIDPSFVVASGAQPESNSLFNFNFGLGVRVAMNEKLATRFEARWRVTDTNLQTSSGLWCDPYGYCYSYSSNWYNAGELEAGLSYSFK